MLNLNIIKTTIKTHNISNYVKSYLEISNEFENLYSNWIDGKIDVDYYNEVLSLYDYLSEKIADYYIRNYYTGWTSY